MSESGPGLPTCVLQPVVGYPGYSGRDADIVADAARDPNRSSHTPHLGPQRRLAALLESFRIGGRPDAVVDIAVTTLMTQLAHRGRGNYPDSRDRRLPLNCVASNSRHQ
jgi:hypothetical protein